MQDSDRLKGAVRGPALLVMWEEPVQAGEDVTIGPL